MVVSASNPSHGKDSSSRKRTWDGPKWIVSSPARLKQDSSRRTLGHCHSRGGGVLPSSARALSAGGLAVLVHLFPLRVSGRPSVQLIVAESSFLPKAGTLQTLLSSRSCRLFTNVLYILVNKLHTPCLQLCRKILKSFLEILVHTDVNNSSIDKVANSVNLLNFIALQRYVLILFGVGLLI